MRKNVAEILKELNLSSLLIPCNMAGKVKLVDITQFQEIEIPDGIDHNQNYLKLLNEYWKCIHNNIESDIEEKLKSISKYVDEEIKKLPEKYNFAGKKSKTKEKVKEEVVYGNSIEIPKDEATVSFTPTTTVVEKPDGIKEKAISNVNELPKTELPKTESFKLVLKNDNSLRDEVIKKCLRQTLDEHCVADIMGNYWDVNCLKTEIPNGFILADALISEEYPPYLSNNNKDELEYINKIYMEKKGRKAFD